MEKERKRPGLNRIHRGCLILSLFLLVGSFLFPETSYVEEIGHAAPEKDEPHSNHSAMPPEIAPDAGRTSHAGHQQQMDGAEHTANQTITLTPEMLKLGEVRTEPAEFRHLVKEIQTVGEIGYDERRVKVVSAWIGGRIDKLYVDFTGINVEKGDPLVDLYSPELVSTQQEFLLALETRARIWSLGDQDALRSAGDLVESTKRRLLLWGISEDQIEEIEKTRKVSTRMTIHAPIGGTVIHKQAYEGQYVKLGEKLYTIVDLSVVWALVDIFEYEMSWVKTGQQVSITTTAYPGRTFTGTVTFIEPFLDKKTRTVKVRMDVPNRDLVLKPGMFAEARLEIPYKKDKPVLSIPHTAVLDTGVRKLVYVDLGKGVFKPVEVQIGPRAGAWVPVLAGLQKGQKIAVSANYLIDSQRALGSGAVSAHGGH